MKKAKLFISVLTATALAMSAAFSVSADNAASGYGSYDGSSVVQSAAERVVPSADPDFEEMTLEEFKAQYPSYRGIKDPRNSTSISPYAVTPDPGYVTSKYSGPFVWKQVGSKWYLYASNGSTKVSTGGWYQENGYWYFLYPTGAKKYDGTTAAGEMAVGWEKIGSYWYYFSSAGIMQTDWTYISSGYYYFRRANEGSYPMGSMLIGAFYLNSEPGSSTKDRNYYFDANGKMQDWTYPLDSSKANNRHVNRNIRVDGHNGIDISSYSKEPIYNVTGGTVLFSGWYQSTVNDPKSGTGNTVIIKTDTNPVLYVRYFHMYEKPVPIVNTHISAGDDIGLVGSTGFSTGTHLHLDVSELKTISANGNPSTLNAEDAKNPAAFFPYINFTGNRAFGADLN